MRTPPASEDASGSRRQLRGRMKRAVTWLRYGAAEIKRDDSAVATARDEAYSVFITHLPMVEDDVCVGPSNACGAFIAGQQTECQPLLQVDEPCQDLCSFDFLH